jgi:hypothetical protein
MADNRFTAGVFTGLATAGVVIQVCLGFLMSGLSDMYKEFGNVAIPGITRLVISPIWLWGVPFVGLVAVSALAAKQPRRLGPYLATAALLIVTIALTWHFAQAPMDALGDVKP